MKLWPTCNKEQLQEHLDEYEFRYDAYTTNPPPTPDEVGTVHDYEKDSEINADTHCYRIQVLKQLIDACKVEIKEYD